MSDFYKIIIFPDFYDWYNLIAYNYCPALGGTSSSNSTKTYKIKTWLSDKAIPAASYTYFYVNTEIVAEVQNAKMAYTLRILSPSPLSGITLQNGSKKATTINNFFVLDNIYPGTYNIEIVFNYNALSV